MKPQFLIGSLCADNGKALLSWGLMRALSRRGLNVQAYECGADLSDTVARKVAVGNAAVNLDTWYSSHPHVQYLYNTYGETADVCVLDSMGGLFDGFRKWQGSGAEMAQVLSVPVVLAVNARTATYSLAPMLHGFRHFRPGVKIAGVIFYQVHTPSQYGFLREVCADAGVESLGYLPYSEKLRLPARYSAMTSGMKAELDAVIQRAAEMMEKTVDLDKLLNLTTRIFPCAYSLPYTSETEPRIRSFHKRIRIAVASDPAFHFLYRQNLDFLAGRGELTFFSPVYGNDLPQADLIYLPGGYPELFARQLHRWKRQLQQLRDFAEAGGRVLAEGGGIALLARTVAARQGGTPYGMSGLLPLDVAVNEGRLCAGYRKVDFAGLALKGYECRYLEIASPHEAAGLTFSYMANLKGVETPGSFICRYKNVIAVTAHCYWENTDILDWWR